MLPNSCLASNWRKLFTEECTQRICRACLANEFPDTALNNSLANFGPKVTKYLMTHD